MSPSVPTLTRQVTVGALSVEARELTVLEVRTYLGGLPERLSQTDLVGSCLVDSVLLPDLPFFTNLKPEDIETLTPSQIKAVWEEVKTANPDFFDLMKRCMSHATSAAEPLQNAEILTM